MCTSRYMKASQMCKNAEKTVNSETENVCLLKKLVNEKFEEVFQTSHLSSLLLSSIFYV